MPDSRLNINVALTGIVDNLLQLADARGVEIGRDSRLRFEKQKYDTSATPPEPTAPNVPITMKTGVTAVTY